MSSQAQKKTKSSTQAQTAHQRHEQEKPKQENEDIHEATDDSMQEGDWGEMTKKISQDLADSAVDFAKKYPVHAAVGAAAAGLVLGLWLSRKK